VRYGGSALFFSDVMRGLHGRADAAGGKSWRVFGVDIDRESIASRVFETEGIELLIADTFSERVARAVRELRSEIPGPMFVVLDADHGKSSVQLELQLVTRLTMPGDYVIVEDSNLNGHPAYPGWGPGPWEAVTEFLAMNRRAYKRDIVSELKFGHTQAPCGFLLRAGEGDDVVVDPIREQPRRLEEEISLSSADKK
jgi:cephalosporin hydroxylase